MIEITENNYKCIKCNGVIIGVPKSENFGYKFSIYFECAFRSDGKHGYPKQGMWFTGDSENFYAIAYDMDYYLKNGFYFDSSNRTSWTNCFNFDKVRYYKFDDFEELCCWYLQRRNFMIEYKNDVGYVPHIHPEEPIEITNHIHCSEVYDMPEIPKENNVYHKKITRREKLKDVLELLDLYKLRENTLDMLKDETIKKRDYTKDLFIQQLERDEERIQRFLDEEIDEIIS